MKYELGIGYRRGKVESVSIGDVLQKIGGRVAVNRKSVRCTDQWIPIEPGTDAALFLGMTSYIIDNELYDEKFMKAHTSFPFPLRPANASTPS